MLGSNEPSWRRKRPSQTRRIPSAHVHSALSLSVVAVSCAWYMSAMATPFGSSRRSLIAAGGAHDVQAKYDPEADALYLRLAETKIVESEEVRPGIVLDLDAKGRVVGIEILDASEHVAEGADFARLTAA